MRAHAKPDFTLPFNLEEELKAIRDHQAHRKIPKPSEDNLLIATWNLTNFGLQKREIDHLAVMAEIIKPFDVVALQEIADDLDDFNGLMQKLGAGWDSTFTDIAGNQERLGYVFKTDRLQPTGLAAELAMRGYERRKITISVGDQDAFEEFEGFNRNPYMISFIAGEFEFTLVNVHLYWSSFIFRQLETKALSKWAKKRVDKEHPPNQDIILIGDFNMPKLRDDDKILRILRKNGLEVPAFNTELVGTNLAGDKHYDEVAFFPSRTGEDFSGRMGVFDFDKKLFSSLWDPDDQDKNKKFFQYIRYYIADHRPLWIEFKRHKN